MVAKIISVGWKGTSEFDPKNKSRNKEINSFKKAIKKINSDIKFIEPEIEDDKKSLETIEKEIMKKYDENTLIVSMDHAVTYPTLKAAAVENLALIVFDQHMDIYSYNTYGKYLNRANVFRIALDQDLVSKIIFVGVRPSEASLLRQTKNLPEHIASSSKKDREIGIFAGFDDKVEIILSEDIESFEEGLFKALEILKKDNFPSIGIDIDLDVFDSEEILGVEFNKNSPLKLLNNFLKKNENNKIPSELSQVIENISNSLSKEKINKKEFEKQVSELLSKIKNIEKSEFLEELEFVLDDFLWYSYQQSEKGMPIEVSKNLKTKFNEKLRESNQKLCYRGITEWIPSNDKNNETEKLVNSLIEFLK